MNVLNVSPAVGKSQQFQGQEQVNMQMEQPLSDAPAFPPQVRPAA